MGPNGSPPPFKQTAAGPAPFPAPCWALTSVGRGLPGKQGLLFHRRVLKLQCLDKRRREGAPGLRVSCNSPPPAPTFTPIPSALQERGRRLGARFLPTCHLAAPCRITPPALDGRKASGSPAAAFLSHLHPAAGLEGAWEMISAHLLRLQLKYQRPSAGAQGQLLTGRPGACGPRGSPSMLPAFPLPLNLARSSRPLPAGRRAEDEDPRAALTGLRERGASGGRGF